MKTPLPLSNGGEKALEAGDRPLDGLAAIGRRGARRSCRWRRRGGRGRVLVFVGCRGIAGGAAPGQRALQLLELAQAGAQPLVGGLARAQLAVDLDRLFREAL